MHVICYRATNFFKNSSIFAREFGFVRVSTNSATSNENKADSTDQQSHVQVSLFKMKK